MTPGRRNGRRDLVIAGCFCAIVGLYDALYLILGWSGGPLIGPSLYPPFPDFLVFHAAARAWLEGKAALIYDIGAFTAFQNALHAGRLPEAVQFRPFLYPPTWLLLVLPFGAFAVGKAYGLFMAVTAGIATALEGRRDWWGWLAILVSPAAVWTAMAGQNTFLSLGLFYGGLRLVERAPALGGLLLGALSYKPQLWVLVPLGLVAARQWRALAWTIGTAIALALLSAIVLGPEIWAAFIDAARAASSPTVANETFERIYMQMTTPLAMARIIGLPPAVSSLLQLAASVLAIVAVWFAFRRHAASNARIAVLAAATFLVSPYALNYDLLLLMPAVVALFRMGVAQGFYPLERLIHLALWLLAPLGWSLNQLGLPMMPLVILLFGVVAWHRSQSKVELPGPAMAS
jgi:alpha-1,2-mannosyltransferase